MDPTKTIVIVGGGFAGTTLVRALDGKLPQGYEVVLISEESYTTVREARHVAANLLAALRGGPTRAFDYKARGSMAAIGHMKGVADVFGIPVWGLPAWLLWRAYYLSQMPTLGRKVRIFVEWTWGMFFPTDITHLHFTRSQDIEEAREQKSASAMPLAARPNALRVA